MCSDRKTDIFSMSGSPRKLSYQIIVAKKVNPWAGMSIGWYTSIGCKDLYIPGVCFAAVAIDLVTEDALPFAAIDA